MTAWIEGAVAGQTRWTDRLLSLQVDAPMGPFEAGQFAKLALDVDGERVARPYSFVNAPGTGPLEFYYAIVPGGPLSPRLAALARGDRVYIAANPAGFLVLSEVPDAQTLWLVSTGTGIGPFLSILRTETPWKRFHRVVLVHAARHANELVYAEVITAISRTHPGRFAYMPVSSRDPGSDSAKGLLRGRIPALLRDGSLEALAGDRMMPDTAQVMLCGNPDMVKDTTVALGERGMKKHRRRDPGQITVENYW